jgi:hypothetical protein
LLQQLCGLLQGDVPRHRCEVRIQLLVVHADLKEQDLAIYVYVETRQFPMPVSDVPLLDNKRSPFGQVTQNPSEFYFANQLALDPNNAFLRRIDPDAALDVIRVLWDKKTPSMRVFSDARVGLWKLSGVPMPKPGTGCTWSATRYTII